jgi:hypothetical protein
MNSTAKDTQILRELASQTSEVAQRAYQDERRALWKDFNSLRTHRVPVYVLDPQGISREIFPEKDLCCEDPLFREYEYWLRLQLYHDSFGDDYVTEPWITVRPVFSNENPNWRSWGIDIEDQKQKIEETMAYHLPEPAITKLEDFHKLIVPQGIIDEARTAEKTAILQDAVGDILAVIPDRYPEGHRGLSYVLAYLLGPEQMLYQLHDQPAMVHALSQTISEATLKIFNEAEQQGWFTNCNQTFLGNAEIQAMPYCHELPPPGPLHTVPMKAHWYYDCSQEFESVGPDMYYEFCLSYEIPLYEKFGLTAYGCCENLTQKIKYLKKISNLRRVAVTPWADDEKCAQQLEDKYIASWRPNPAEMITNGFDVERIQRIVRRAKKIYESHGCYWEVNLKDFLSVEYDYDRLKNWVKVVRDVLDE